MIFGDKTQFAIEVLLDRRGEAAPEYEFGYLCFWVEGNQVGDIEAATIVTILKHILKTFCDRQNLRMNNDLWNLPDSDVFQFIQAIYYDSDIPLPEALCKIGYSYSRPVLTFPDGHSEKHSKFGYAFELCSSGPEPFDGTRMLVVENTEGQQRIIYEQRGIHSARNAVFPSGTIESVARKFIDAFQGGSLLCLPVDGNLDG